MISLDFFWNVLLIFKIFFLNKFLGHPPKLCWNIDPRSGKNGIANYIPKFWLFGGKSHWCLISFGLEIATMFVPFLDQGFSQLDERTWHWKIVKDGELTSWNDRWLRRDGRLYMRVPCVVIVKWSVWEVGGSVVDRCRELMIWCEIFDLLRNRGRVDS